MLKFSLGKKITSCVLSSALVLASASTLLAQDATVNEVVGSATSINSTLENATEESHRITVLVDNLWVVSTPNVNGTVVGYLYKNSSDVWFDPELPSAPYPWVPVYQISTGIRGYVQDYYIGPF